MIEPRESEIDVGQLMAEIREAVRRREAEGQKSLIGASLELHKLLSTVDEPVSRRLDFSTLDFQPGQHAGLPALSLQPDFAPRADDHYHVNDLLKYHDHLFVWNAYRAILKREPDETGLREFLGRLRGGRFNKIDVLASLRFSPEGKGRNVRVDGLSLPALLRRSYRLPVVGYLLEWAVAIVRLPALLRSQRQFEGHALAQQQLIADHLNQLGDTHFQIIESITRELREVSAQLSRAQRELAESFTRELHDVSSQQRKFAELEHQQIAGLYREQREIFARLKRLRDDVESRLLGLQERTKSGGKPTTPWRKGANENQWQFDDLLASFTEEFRGGRESIKEGLRFYLPLLKAAGVKDAVLDIGCGRGEWLELLREEGISGRGVEINRLMSERTRGLGFEVICGDALAYLHALPDESLNAVTGFHFIEHLSFETFIELLDEIARTLRPGGAVIFETPNPKNLVVGACNFYSDPTHLKPLFPETVQFIMRKRGFTDARIEYLNPVEDSPFDDWGQRSEALNVWLYGPRDFAAVGRKAPASTIP
jgi:SAM-dependent methyltransferase